MQVPTANRDEQARQGVASSGEVGPAGATSLHRKRMVDVGKLELRRDTFLVKSAKTWQHRLHGLDCRGIARAAGPEQALSFLLEAFEIE
jgi:hypothetical protein